MRLPELNEVVLILDVFMLKPAAQLVDPQMLLVVDGISDPMQDLVVQLLRSGTDDSDHLASDIIDPLSNTLLKFGKRRLQFPALIDQQFNGDAVVEPARENVRIRRPMSIWAKSLHFANWKSVAELLPLICKMC